MQRPLMFWVCLIAATVMLPQTIGLTLLAVLVFLCCFVAIVCYHNSMAGKNPGWNRIWWIFAGVLIMAWTLGWLDWQLGHRWPVERDGEDVRLLLEIESVQQEEDYRSLQVRVLERPADLGVPIRRLRLGWYGRQGRFSHALPVVGDRLDAVVRLRAVRGLANGLPFDNEANWLRKKIDGRGYLRLVMSVQSPPDVGVRQRWVTDQQAKQDPVIWSWISGLVLGQQDAFDREQWRLAQMTGTLHLLVVSGLHLGLLCAFVYAALAGLWRLLAVCGFSVFVHYWHEARWARAAVMLLLTAGYLWLAGAGVALQRAWLMLAVLVLVYGTGWRLSVLNGWLLALLVIPLINPLMLISPGFQYSMLAVLALLAFLSGRSSGWFDSLWRPQWLVFMAVMPVALYWLQPVSPVHLLANTVAIPVLGFLLLPLVLLNLVWPAGVFAAPLVQLSDYWWQGLQWAAGVDLPVVSGIGSMAWWLWVVLLLMVYLGVSPWRAGVAMLGCVLVLFSCSPKIPERLLMLDVGQGLSVMVSAGGNTLVYDTGARYSEQFSVADQTLLPLLRQQRGGGEIDVVISHSDQDHAGGVEALLKRGPPVRQWFAGQDLLLLPAAHDCHAKDASWRDLDLSVRWRFLPVPVPVGSDDNDHSCVVMLEWFGQALLLMGDLGIAQEARLVERYGEQLRADILVASHHGSRSGSSQLLLNVVNPREVWFSAGFHNHFGHPHVEVLDRLRQAGIPWRNTATDGAVEMFPDGSVRGMRTGWQPVWRQP